MNCHHHQPYVSQGFSAKIKNDLTVFKILCIRIYWNFDVITSKYCRFIVGIQWNQFFKYTWLPLKIRKVANNQCTRFQWVADNRCCMAIINVLHHSLQWDVVLQCKHLGKCEFCGHRRRNSH